MWWCSLFTDYKSTLGWGKDTALGWGNKILLQTFYIYVDNTETKKILHQKHFQKIMNVFFLLEDIMLSLCNENVEQSSSQPTSVISYTRTTEVSSSGWELKAV